MLRFAPREADVENVRGEGWDIDGRTVVVDRGSLGRDRGEEEWRERREKEVGSVENVDECMVRLGMRRRDLRDVVSTEAKPDRRLRADLFLWRIGALDGMESRTHLNMRPQIRHILEEDVRNALRVEEGRLSGR